MDGVRRQVATTLSIGGLAALCSAPSLTTAFGGISSLIQGELNLLFPAQEQCQLPSDMLLMHFHRKSTTMKAGRRWGTSRRRSHRASQRRSRRSPGSKAANPVTSRRTDSKSLVAASGHKKSRKRMTSKNTLHSRRRASGSGSKFKRRLRRKHRKHGRRNRGKRAKGTEVRKAGERGHSVSTGDPTGTVATFCCSDNGESASLRNEEIQARAQIIAEVDARRAVREQLSADVKKLFERFMAETSDGVRPDVSLQLESIESRLAPLMVQIVELITENKFYYARRTLNTLLREFVVNLEGEGTANFLVILAGFSVLHQVIEKKGLASGEEIRCDIPRLYNLEKLTLEDNVKLIGGPPDRAVKSSTWKTLTQASEHVKIGCCESLAGAINWVGKFIPKEKDRLNYIRSLFAVRMFSMALLERSPRRNSAPGFVGASTYPKGGYPWKLHPPRRANQLESIYE